MSANGEKPLHQVRLDLGSRRGEQTHENILHDIARAVRIAQEAVGVTQQSRLVRGDRAGNKIVRRFDKIMAGLPFHRWVFTGFYGRPRYFLGCVL